MPWRTANGFSSKQYKTPSILHAWDAVKQQSIPDQLYFHCVKGSMLGTIDVNVTPVEGCKAKRPDDSNSTSSCDKQVERAGLKAEISKQVVRKKLAKQRHLVVEKAIHPEYLDSLFPALLEHFEPQVVNYNGGVAKVKEWKISCYLEVMQGGIPCTNPNTALLNVFTPLLDTCNDLFVHWYRQQHACNRPSTNFSSSNKEIQVKRLMTFITRYTPNPGEQALLKHVDGAGKVDGSIVVALPTDRWSAAEEINAFEGGGLTFWDGRDTSKRPREIHYDTRSGDLAFIDRAVWHQADPITKGTRWAIVIFYEVCQS